MRGDERIQDGMFSYVFVGAACASGSSIACSLQADGCGVADVEHGVRCAVCRLRARLGCTGVHSASPVLQVFYSVRSERLLVEQIDYTLLFRWFVGLGIDDAVWNHAVFSKNRDRLLTSDVVQQFFAEVNKKAKRFISDEHFTVDGALIQAWASQKSFRSKDGFNESDPTRPMNRLPTPMHVSQEELRQGVEAELSWSCSGGEP
jgi:hypothetical protein